jgi:hypothetical protein
MIPSFFFFLRFLLWCRGHIVTFTKVLTICRIQIHPLHHSPLSPNSHSWNSFSSSHFSIYLHVYIIFSLCSPTYTHHFLVFSPPTGTSLLDGNCSALLFSVFIKRKLIFLVI